MEKCVEQSISELSRVFNELNNYYFDGELEEPVIIIQTGGKNSGVLGWFITKRIWTNRDTGELKYEITVVAEYLSRPVMEIVSTLLHEMVHLYCTMNSIKDTSNGPVYHNKKYKAEAEKHGLEVEKHSKYGYAVTRANPDTISFLQGINIDGSAFNWVRNDKPSSEDGEEEKPKKKRKKPNKYVCNGCETEITSKKPVHATCIECNLPFEKISEDDDAEEGTSESNN